MVTMVVAVSVLPLLVAVTMAVYITGRRIDMAGNIPTPFIPVAKVPGVADIRAGRNRSRQDCWIAYHGRAVVAGREARYGFIDDVNVGSGTQRTYLVAGRDHGRVHTGRWMIWLAISPLPSSPSPKSQV